MLGDDRNNQDFETDAVNIQGPDNGHTSDHGYNPSNPSNKKYPVAHAEAVQAPYATHSAADDLRDSQEQAKYLKSKAETFINSHGGTHLLLVVVSFLLLVKASSDIADVNHQNRNRPSNIPRIDKPKGYGFAIFVSLITMLLAGVHLYSVRKPGILSENAKIAVLLVLLIIWTFAVGFLTFGDVYNTTGNGYFATWVGFFLALTIFTNEIKEASFFLGKFKTLGWQLGTLLISSIILFFASIAPCKDNCTGSVKFGLVIGILSTLFSLFIFYFVDKLGGKVRIGLFGVLLILWIAVVFVCTFVSPFVHTGNGYFASWFGFIASILLFHKMVQSNVTSKPNNVDMV